MSHLPRVVIAFALVSSCLTAVASSAPVPTPTIEGPVTGGLGMPFIAATTFDPSAVGYVQEEYFISGTATAFTNTGPLGSDGTWTVTPGDTAPYKTRIVVYRPASRPRFDGTVVVEWLNVSGGLDAAPDWIAAHTAMIHEGMAWVGVSAQSVGVEGGSGLLGLPPRPLKTVDPARYGSLSHPGDSFSYDIFSQAGQALRHPSGPDPLGGLPPKVLIADGESQSAFRMVTYIDAVHPVAGIYDGFLVHSRGAGGLLGAPLSELPEPAIGIPSPTLIRPDLDVPVLTLQSETDLLLLQSLAARQADTARLRLWEIAGTAHADAYTLVAGATDLGKSPDAADLVLTSSPLGAFTCGQFINSGPQHFVVKSAIHWLDRWVRRGTPPPSAPRLVIDPGPPAHLVLDAHGNATGGIRTPELDVPIATLSGGGQSGSLACLLFGTTVPFDAVTLHALYPTHRAYVSAFNRATLRALRAGFVLTPDAKLMRAAALRSDVGR